MRLRNVIICFSALFSMSSYVAAAKIYDESVNGDSAPWINGGGAPVGTPVAGDYILGTMSDTQTTPSSYWDGYSFTYSGLFSTIDIFALSTGPYYNGWQLYGLTDLFGTLRSGVLKSTAPTQLITFDMTGLAAGTYALGNNGVIPTEPYDYEICFRNDSSCAASSKVPEPATIALMGLGFAVIGYMRRRQAQA